VHAVAQQTLPPPAVATHAPFAQSPPAVHACPFGRSAQCRLWQTPLVQSDDAAHPAPVPQVFACPSHVAPPQSTSVSVPFCTPSEHVAAWHVFPALQILLVQSPPTLHFLVSPHGEHDAPPQSTSVSSPSITPSLQCAETHVPRPSQTTPPLSVQVVPFEAFDLPHTFPVHVRVAQSVPVAGQSVGARHATQLPEPSHFLPPFDAHVAPCDAFVVPHTPAVHVAVTQSFAGTGQSDGLVHPVSPPVSVPVSVPTSTPLSAAVSSVVPSTPPSVPVSSVVESTLASAWILDASKSTRSEHPPTAPAAERVRRAATETKRVVLIQPRYHDRSRRPCPAVDDDARAGAAGRPRSDTIVPQPGKETDR
jgi:hypothetical protein